jgi:protein-disulfide isomerase
MTRALIRAVAATMMIMACAAMGMAAEQADPRVTLDIAGHPYAGPANAPVTVVVFSDYL